MDMPIVKKYKIHVQVSYTLIYAEPIAELEAAGYTPYISSHLP